MYTTRASGGVAVYNASMLMLHTVVYQYIQYVQMYSTRILVSYTRNLVHEYLYTNIYICVRGTWDVGSRKEKKKKGNKKIKKQNKTKKNPHFGAP